MRFRTLALVFVLAAAALAADLEVPEHTPAHTAVTIRTIGEGSGVLYLVGPVARTRREARLGDQVQFQPEEIGASGFYTAILLSGGSSVSKTFFVSWGEPRGLSFLAQPSRVPTNVKGVISGTVFVRDEDDNLVLAPLPVTFELAVTGASSISRTVQTRDGVAWSQIDSSRHAGNAQFTASARGVSVRRVVQQVAAEPCNLRFHAQPAKGGIRVETEPVRDCAGNAVPDGTIVSFTEWTAQGISAVDAVVKKGLAQAMLPSATRATLSVASGVVGGNEILWSGGTR